MRTAVKNIELHEFSDGVLHRSDAIHLLRLLPSESINLIITDSAYQSLEKWRSIGSTTRLKHSKGSSNDWFITFPNERYYELFTEFYRVMKPGTHLYMFCDEETRDLICTGYSPQTKKYIEKFEEHDCMSPLGNTELKYWKSLIWDKEIKGMGYHYPAQHEFILLIEKVEKKGKHRRLNSNTTGDVLEFKRLKGPQYYPTEKPEELISVLIKESSNEGDIVLDPFVGGGTTVVAAKKLGRRFFAGDISQKAIEYTLSRLLKQID